MTPWYDGGPFSLWIHTMNRCSTRLALFPPVARTLATLGVAFLATFSHAQEGLRTFPANALRGTMQITQPPELLMDGNTMRLAPGARIKNTNNLLVLSGNLVGQSLVVAYVRDPQGQVHEAWILNAAEAQRPMASAASTHNYVSQYENGSSTDGTKSSLSGTSQP